MPNALSLSSVKDGVSSFKFSFNKTIFHVSHLKMSITLLLLFFVYFMLQVTKIVYYVTGNKNNILCYR